MTTTTNLRRRVEQLGFGLLELSRIDGRRFIIFDGAHGLFIHGNHEKPLTLEEVAAFIEPYEADPFTCEPT